MNPNFNPNANIVAVLYKQPTLNYWKQAQLKGEGQRLTAIFKYHPTKIRFCIRYKLDGFQEARDTFRSKALNRPCATTRICA